MANTLLHRKRRSVALSKDELKSLRKYRRNYPTEVDCAISIGIDRVVLNRVMRFGSGSEETVSKIRFAIFEENTGEDGKGTIGENP